MPQNRKQRAIRAGFTFQVLTNLALVQALARFEELVNKVNDMLTNRVESNLALISRMLLINLPADQSFSYEEFGTLQARFIQRQGTAISVRNQEVRRSVQELIQLICTTPRENPDVKMDRDAAANFNDHFYLRMYGAIAAAMRNSFTVLKERVAPARGGGGAPPFFDVEVDLKVPDVVVSPSLDEIQEAVNTCAKKVLTVTKDLKPWAVDRGIGSFWDMLSQDLDIVKSVLLLKGTIDTAKETVRGLPCCVTLCARILSAKAPKGHGCYFFCAAGSCTDLIPEWYGAVDCGGYLHVDILLLCQWVLSDWIPACGLYLTQVCPMC